MVDHLICMNSLECATSWRVCRLEMFYVVVYYLSLVYIIFRTYEVIKYIII
jgi:hypothetical protein